LQLDIVVPILMSCVVLWWVSRGMRWTNLLAVVVVTLILVYCIVLVERSGVFVIPGRE
jgi:hypothetical protein